MRRAVAEHEAAFPTPCLDPFPCPVVVSVSSVAEKADPIQTGNWTAGRLAMGASRHPNPPDWRSPSLRGGKHGNRTTTPPHDPREKVSRVSSAGRRGALAGKRFDEVAKNRALSCAILTV